MVAGASEHIIRGPGRLIVDSGSNLTAFATTAYPYGATEVGLVNQVRLRSQGTAKLIWNEGLGQPTDLLDGTDRWQVSCFVRGVDDDAKSLFFQGWRSAGSVTQHGVLTAPGTRSPGQSGVDSINLRLVLVPDDLIHMDGLIVYRAVPSLGDNAELAWERREEFGFPMTFECFSNASGNIWQTGRLSDLSLT